jgi:hypothetical protein
MMEKISAVQPYDKIISSIAWLAAVCPSLALSLRTTTTEALYSNGEFNIQLFSPMKPLQFRAKGSVDSLCHSTTTVISSMQLNAV